MLSAIPPSKGLSLTAFHQAVVRFLFLRYRDQRFPTILSLRRQPSMPSDLYVMFVAIALG